MFLATAVIVHHSWHARAFQLDDALIYQRYFYNFYAGKGLVYNEGVHFNGLTSPLYAYLMLVVGFFIRNLQHAAVVVFTGCLTLASWLLFRFGLRRGDGLGTAIGVLIGVSLPYYYLTLGMETALFLMLIAACLCLYQDARYGWLAVAGALLVLTRGEGVFLLAALGLAHLVERRRWPSWRILIAPAIILALHYSFNRYYYGAFIPETGSAKIWQGQSGLWGTEKPLFVYADYLLDWTFLGHLWFFLLMVGLAGFGLLSTLRRSWYILLFAGMYAAFYCVLNIPNYHWYYSALYLTLTWYAGIGLVTLCTRFVEIDLLQTKQALISAVLSLACAGVLVHYILARVNVSNGPSVAYQEAGTWMNSHLPADAKVATSEIGTVGFYSQRYIIDILGLVNPNNARYIGERRFEAWLNDYHPDYFLVHVPMWPGEVAVQHQLEQGKLWTRADFNMGTLKLYCRAGQQDCQPLGSTSVKTPWNMRIYERGSDQLPAHSARMGGGTVNQVTQDGATLHLAGELAPGYKAPGMVLLALPGMPVQSTIIGADQEHPEDPHFGIDLRFQNEADATAAARSWCAAVQGPGGVIALLSTVRPPCDRLL